MEEIEYGYMEGGTLVSRFFEEQRIYTNDKDGKQRLKVITVEEQVAALSEEWKPVERISDFMLESTNPYEVVIPVPYDAGTHIAYDYQKRFDVQQVKTEIQGLKDALTSSDYKVSKCYEASLLGHILPYDIEFLHEERQAQRDQINYLEGVLANNGLK
jgi:hypothetical protein